MQHAANQAPFGPFPSDPKGDVDRQTSGTVDVRGAADWRTVFSVDCGASTWGQLVIVGEAAPSPTVARARDAQAWPWIEVRIDCYYNGQATTYLEAAAAGPIFAAFGVGEVPDRIEVKARARRGGAAELAGDADERLSLVAVSRFHR
jgi:hypothetical protein